MNSSASGTASAHPDDPARLGEAYGVVLDLGDGFVRDG
jgi:hypothetical protein